MLVIGYRSNVNTSGGILAVQKHTGKPRREAKQLIDTVMEGKPITLDPDWVLREDLEDNGFIIN